MYCYIKSEPELWTVGFYGQDNKWYPENDCGSPTEAAERVNYLNGGIGLNSLRDKIHRNAINHGWWDDERSFGDIIALIHSELSEALEEFRNHRHDIYWQCPKCGACVHPDQLHLHKQPLVCCREKMKPEGIPIELADCIIRILDYCGEEEIDIENAILIKHEFNKTRPYRHGGKRL